MDIFELQAHLQKTPEQHSGRYYGFISGNITNVNDDQGLVRVKARIGAMGDTEESDWLIPAFPGSIECKPLKGDPCIVGFIDGDPNRGFWLYHPESTTKARPSEFMVLGNTMVGMFNYLVDQFNQLRSDHNSHTHQVPYSWTGVAGSSTATAAVPTASASLVGNKGNASDGSTVPNVATSKTVLSGLCKVK